MDNAYFIGDGSSTYANQIGLISGLSSSSSYITATGAWSAITTGDFNKLMGSVEYVNPARLGFVCSRQFFAQVMQRLDKATSQFKPLADGNLSGQNATFLGYPVYFSQVLPTATASTSKCVYFGDFTGGSMIGDRSQLNIATSTDFYFDSDAIAIRGIARFAVAIHGAGRGETYGPICGLVTT
jgi:HK97 family phage major capsid protein